MRTQQGWTNGDGSGGRRSGLATCAVILSSALGLVLPAQPAGAQTLDGSVGAVQPNAVRAAQRHQARLTDNDTLVDAAAEQPLRQGPPVEMRGGVSLRTDRPVLLDSRFGEAQTVLNSTRSKPMNRTVHAYLETYHQVTGVPPTAMVCQDCEPERPCSVWRCHGNSSSIDGAAIVVRR